jgi:CheY-like chemotaxis protein
MTINKKVLIAEDELLIAKVLRMQLESIGFEVENVTDGREVFDKVKQMNPHIIILDVHLKNSSCGLEVGREIRAAGIDTPIIFTTGNSFDNTYQMVKDIGKSNVLIKPVEFEQILQLISQFYETFQKSLQKICNVGIVILYSYFFN